MFAPMMMLAGQKLLAGRLQKTLTLIKQQPPGTT